MIHRGDIYFIRMAGRMGKGKAGRCPVLVVSSDALNALPLAVVVVPGTDASHLKRDFLSTVRVTARETGLPTDTVFLCHQLRSLDPEKLLEPGDRRPVVAGRLSRDRMREVEQAIQATLDQF